MLIKRFKEWITTLLGLLLLAGAGFMLYKGKITTGEFTAFMPVCLGLFWAKNSFITDLTKLGRGGAAVILVLLALTACRTTKIPAVPTLPATTSSSSTNTATSGGETQNGYTKPDSASIKALVACDSLGNVYIRQIASLQTGHSVKPSVTVKDNYITLKCEVDSLAVYNKWLRFYNQTSDTLIQVKTLPGTVTNELTWLQTFLVKLGWAFVGFIVLLAGYIFLRFKKLINPF